MSALLDAMAAAFEAAPAASTEAGGLGEARRAALAAARADGLPTQRMERWRYATPLRALERRAFALADADAGLDAAALAAAGIDLPPAPRLVFVDGRASAALSDLAGLPAGVEVRALSGLLRDPALHPRDVAWLARRFDGADEAFARLNAALAADGAVIRVDAGVQAEAPLHLLQLASTGASERAWHLRHLVELREDASLVLVEQSRSLGAPRPLGNALAQVHLKPRATLRHLRVQDEAAGGTALLRTDAVLAREATYRRCDLELGGGWSRHELNVALQGEQAHLHAHGVLLGGGRRVLDTRLAIDHAARDGACDLVWRGLADGRARLAFHGGIRIREGADGTAAELSNRNLLLSADAEIDTQPVLEIDADEVQAAHGATVGRLDPNHLFYLRSRGIPEAEARRMLTAAFAREVLGVLDHADAEALGLAALDAALARPGFGA
jgi:Fe-S cluster assembly protein SufD